MYVFPWEHLLGNLVPGADVEILCNTSCCSLRNLKHYWRMPRYRWWASLEIKNRDIYTNTQRKPNIPLCCTTGNLSKTLMKSDEPFTAEAMKCCVEASPVVVYSNGLAQSLCTLGSKWWMELLFVWSVSSVQPLPTAHWKYVSFSTSKILYTQNWGL